MMGAIGRRQWAIAEGSIPTWRKGPAPELTSHQTVCLLDTGDQDAHVEITIFFSDREPAGPYPLTAPARRTRPRRFNKLTDPKPILSGSNYATMIDSDVAIVLQHTPLESRQAENALLSIIAFAGDA